MGPVYLCDKYHFHMGWPISVSELEKLAAGNRRKRSVSCDRTGVLKIVAFYDEAFLSR